MTIWAGLIVSRVLNQADYIAPDGATVDALLAGAGPRVEIAELIGQACRAHGLGVPLDDDLLRPYLVSTGRVMLVDLSVRGLILALADGRLALSIGNGRAVESVGQGMGVVARPEPGRYVEAFKLPGVDLLGGRPA